MDNSGRDVEATDRKLGAEVARIMYDQWAQWNSEILLERQFEPSFAAAFIDEFSAVQSERAGSVDRVSSKRAGMSAGQLTEEPYRGILEVLQNAEDESATYLVVALRRKGSRKELIFVHDGTRVGARSVVAMTSAYLSLKEDDAAAIGKFGIGLKTLQRLGREMEVHCAPYHWAVVGGDARRVDASPDIDDLYVNDSGQTMIMLRLDNGHEADELYEWFKSTDARSLLFLNNIKTLEYRELGRQPRTLVRSLAVAHEASYEIQVGQRWVTCIDSTLESEDGQSWRRYTVDLPVGKGLARRYKAVGDTVSLGLAVSQDTQPGLLFSGLPTGKGIGLPFDLGGPYESDVSRERVDASSSWNNWLLEESRKFAQALAIRALHEDPRSAWPLIGTRTDLDAIVPGSWLSDRMTKFVEDQQRAVAGAKLRINQQEVRLRDVVFESESLSGVLSDADIETVRPESHALPKKYRDAGRWRDVLLDMLDDPQVGVAEAIALFDAESGATQEPSWFVGLGAAAVEFGAGDALFKHNSIMCADGDRVTPCKDGQGLLLVSRGLADTDLVARLSLARQIHPAFTSENRAAETVRLFLIKHGAFAEVHCADAVLRALAGRVDEPIALNPEDLNELAGFLAEASAETVAAVSGKLGLAVTVDGYEWIDGERAYGAVLPAKAYLPAAMDVPNGWVAAAGTTEGIRWVHPKYKKSIKGEGEIGPRKLFKILGAEIAPRLQKPVAFTNGQGQSLFRLGEHSLPRLWHLELDQLEATSGHRPLALYDDWGSPDLIAVALDIQQEDVNSNRRARVKALMRTLEGSWTRLYESASHSRAAYMYYKWYPAGSMSTRWVAELADIEWLSDCAKPSKPLAPVEGRIRSDANASLYGDGGEAYVRELGPEDADSPVVKALGIRGLPRASEHMDELRALNESQKKIGWSDVAHHYMALAGMCPEKSSPKAAIDDVPVEQLRREFSKYKLLWCDDWVSPAEAFRGDPLFPKNPFVVEAPEYTRLWELLEIKHPTASDCVRHLRAWAQDAPQESRGQQLLDTYRTLAKLAGNLSARERSHLKRLPVWTEAGWTATRPVYYALSGSFSRTLSSSGVPMWVPPGALHCFDSLPEYLGLELVSPESFAVESSDASDVFDSWAPEIFPLAVGHMREFVAKAMPDVYTKIDDAMWLALEGAVVEMVPELILRGKIGAKLLRVESDIFLDRRTMTFYFRSSDQIGRSEQGGDLVAEACDLGPSDRLQLSLAWAESWRRASDGQGPSQLVFRRRTPEYAEGEPVPISRPSQTPVARKKGVKQKTNTAVSTTRTLVDVEALAPRVIRDAGEPTPGGLVRDPGTTIVESPRAAVTHRAESAATDRKSAPSYTLRDQEDVGMEIVERVLADRGIEIEDTRSQPTGADAIGTDGRYYELKVHSGLAQGALNFTRAEVFQAQTLGENYVLVVVENVESGGADPRVTFIPNPLGVLKVHPRGRIELTGYDSEAFEQVELVRS